MKTPSRPLLSPRCELWEHVRCWGTIRKLRRHGSEGNVFSQPSQLGGKLDTDHGGQHQNQKCGINFVTHFIKSASHYPCERWYMGLKLTWGWENAVGEWVWSFCLHPGWGQWWREGRWGSTERGLSFSWGAAGSWHLWRLSLPPGAPRTCTCSKLPCPLNIQVLNPAKLNTANLLELWVYHTKPELVPIHFNAAWQHLQHCNENISAFSVERPRWAW